MKPAHAALALLLIAPLPLAGGAAGDDRVWIGTMTHDLEYDQTGLGVPVYRALYGGPECHGSGVALVHVDLAAGSLELVNPDTACVPGFTTLGSGCALDADGHVRCERIGATFEIRADIAPDGAFEFTYLDTSFPGGFYERITGSLVRVV